MLEKRLAAVPSQLFTANGAVNGVITIADACIFRVKQEVVIKANTLNNLDRVEVKRVLNDTQLVIGPCGGSIHKTIDVSAYTTALGTVIQRLRL
jgi:hypothetical protein